MRRGVRRAACGGKRRTLSWAAPCRGPGLDLGNLVGARPASGDRSAKFNLEGADGLRFALALVPGTALTPEQKGVVVSAGGEQAARAAAPAAEPLATDAEKGKHKVKKEKKARPGSQRRIPFHRPLLLPGMFASGQGADEAGLAMVLKPLSSTWSSSRPKRATMAELMEPGTDAIS